MPFTIDGQWMPSPSAPQKDKGPVKVRLVKRGKSLLTAILNLNRSAKELDELCANLKKKLGCGGIVKDETIEIQGDKVQAVKKHLADIGIKSS